MIMQRYDPTKESDKRFEVPQVKQDDNDDIEKQPSSQQQQEVKEKDDILSDDTNDEPPASKIDEEEREEAAAAEWWLNHSCFTDKATWEHVIEIQSFSPNIYFGQTSIGSTIILICPYCDEHKDVTDYGLW